ncbi:GGDEF domain-containing protein [Geobacter pickeringii]|nr:diguanylate cyclase [Geobacter pickeringii]
MMKEVAEYLDRQSRQGFVALGYVLIVLVGLVDYLTKQLTSEPFYLIPLALITWSGSRRNGFVAAFCCSGIWYAVNRYDPHDPGPFGVQLWNLTLQAGLFLIFVMLFAALRSAHDYRKLMTRLDPLTGMLSGIFFQELALVEIRRSERYEHPFTLAIIEFDLATVRSAGDSEHLSSLLRSVAGVVRAAVRGTDMAARLDFATFAVMLPETPNESGRVVVKKLQEQLAALLSENRWQVPFGIGATTFMVPPAGVDEMFRKVGGLAHSASRRSSTTTVRYEVVDRAMGVA